MSKRRAIGIVRVSQVSGREGESFVSPAQQRDRIESSCVGSGLALVGCHEELDVPGKTPLDQRRGLTAAIEAIEAGRAEVLISAFFDRLVRSLKVQQQIVERVERAGGEVFAVDVGAVSEASASKKLSGTLLGAINEYQADIARERSGDAQRRAVERGVVPWPNIPPGYVKREDGTLEPHSTEPPAVAEAFRLRSEEATVKEVRAHLKAHGIERTWHGVQAMLQSRIYLGEIHFGQLHNLSAHEPIVDREVWAKAQRTEIRGPQAKSDRLLARQGVLRCGTCGGRMSIGTQTQRGRKYGFYKCSPLGDCPARAAIGADIVEGVVVAHVRAALADVEGRASAESNARDAERELVRAQEQLDAAIRALADLTAEPAAVETLERLREARDGARERVSQIGGGSTVTLSIAADWDALTLDEQRALVRATVERAEVSPGKGPGRVTVQLFV